MTFMIYNERGMPIPYHPEEDWRRVRLDPAIEAKLPSFEKETPKRQGSGQGKDDKTSSLPLEKIFFKGDQSKDPSLLAEHVMTRDVDYLFEKDSLEVAVNMFYRKKFRHIPVLDSEENIVGILSDRSITHFLLLDGGSWDFKDKTVKEVMISPVFTSSKKALLSDIARKFVDERIGAMPIVNSKGKLLGILTRSDLLKTMVSVSRGDIRV